MLRRQLSLSACVHQELVLLVENIAQLESMIYQILVCIRGIICCYTAKPRKKIASFNTNESVNTDITDVRSVAIDLISDIAMLFDLLAAGTAIKLFTDLYPNEGPFSSGGIEIVGH